MNCWEWSGCQQPGKLLTDYPQVFHGLLTVLSTNRAAGIPRHFPIPDGRIRNAFMMPERPVSVKGSRARALASCVRAGCAREAGSRPVPEPFRKGVPASVRKGLLRCHNAEEVEVRGSGIHQAVPVSFGAEADVARFQQFRSFLGHGFEHGGNPFEDDDGFATVLMDVHADGGAGFQASAEELGAVLDNCAEMAYARSAFESRHGNFRDGIRNDFHGWILLAVDWISCMPVNRC